MEIIKVIISAILNRCRGSQWFGLVPYTGIGRILAAIGLAIINAYSQSWLCIILLSLGFLNWSIWAWDAYWAAASGNNKVNINTGIGWINYTLNKLKITPASRLWGAIGMGLRQGVYAIPIFLIMSYFCNITYLYYIPIPFLFGLPYLIFSYIFKTQFVMASELLIGAVWAILLGV